jgi:ankyrin repeat protein
MKSKNRYTQLVRIIQAGDIQKLQKLLETEIAVDSDVEEGCSLLQYAVQERQDKMVSYLLSCGADPDYGGTSFDDGATLFSGPPIFQAIQAYEPKLVRILLQAGANPNASERSLDCPPLIAASHLDGFIAKQLLDYGADVNQRTPYGVTALMNAVHIVTLKRVSYEDCELVKILLNAGAKEEGILEAQFIAYAELNNVDRLKDIVEQGVNIDSIISSGKTALMSACSGKSKEAVIYLLSIGANLNIINYESALISAVRSHDLELVKLLIENSADINLRNIYGTTALSYAYIKDIRSFLKMKGGKK